MLKDLIKLANELDSKGLVKQADLVDKAISKRALWDDYYGQPEDYRSNTAEEMMEDFNKRLSRGEQDKFVQMFASVINGWEELKKNRPEETTEETIDGLEQANKIYSPEEFSKMSDDNLVRLYADLPDTPKEVNIDFYKELVKRHKNSGSIDLPDRQNTDEEVIVNPIDLGNDNGSQEEYILRDLLRQGFNKSYLQELYNQT